MTTETIDAEEFGRNLAMTLTEINLTMQEMTRGDGAAGMTAAAFYAALIFNTAGFSEKEFIKFMKRAWRDNASKSI